MATYPNPKPMTLGRAQAHAERFMAHLLPFAIRIQIAGSIRRRRPEVNDIDLVIEARDKNAILARVKERGTIITGDSATAQNTIVRLGDRLEYQLDMFFTRQPDCDLLAPIPGNWGSVLLCRTGSQRHNIAFAQRAEKMGLKFEPYRGVTKGGQVIASETEEAMYAALELPFLQPVGEREASF